MPNFGWMKAILPRANNQHIQKRLPPPPFHSPKLGVRRGYVLHYRNDTFFVIIAKSLEHVPQVSTCLSPLRYLIPAIIFSEIERATQECRETLNCLVD